MALREEYVRTGNSGITRFANKLSVIPIIGYLSAPVALLGVIWDSGKWLVRGKIGSAATELVTGTVSAAINTMPFTSALGEGIKFSKIAWWGANATTAGVSGHTMGTHGRKLAEQAIESLTGALGMKPTVLQSYTAGVGAIPGAGAAFMQNQGPGYWATRQAQAQGQDPNARWQQYRNGEGREHIEALQAAAMQQPKEQRR